MKSLILLITFFTRIPIKVNIEYDENEFIKGFIYLPALGLFIGFLMYLFSFLPVDKIIYVLLSWIFYIWITGGLHLDGVADTFDGLFSNRSKEEILKIMKDSRIGTFGVLGLIMVLFSDIIFSYYTDYIYMILMPAVGRSSGILAAAISEYSRKNGLGNLFIDNCNLKTFFISFLIISPILLFYKPFIIFPILLTYLGTVFITQQIKKKIDGMTGDTIGLIIEFSQLFFLMFIYMFRGYYENNISTSC
ncbi:adenosylcobinamide-GDP ribazoletransferase [Marinitoga lauensis]|uniref:adenosylcobinamide-GDP ribazoletransferase n=1 Tax=Marinitoga lauensis TaxID=2201189 RepID=UPI001012D63E|nr:adenosylcobinamide-GDP ribazoletransferase [Marinitoga lauensis]